MKALLLTLTLAVLSVCCVADAAEPPPYTKNVAIVVWDGVELLDFGGPGEVFAAAASFGRADDQPAYRVYTVAPAAQPILSQGFVRVQPEYTIDNAPRADVIVIPGGNSAILTEDPKFMKWAATAVEQAEVSLSVCTGAFVLAKLGVLDGLDVTTYYGAIDRMRKIAPKARVHDGRRFIDNGKTITTAGVSAGIDGSLHLVARQLGRVVAERTAQYMEYRWSPDSYLASSYSLLNPRLDDRGRRLQQAAIHLQSGKPELAVQAYRQLLGEYPGDHRIWLSLGHSLFEQKEYGEAVKAYAKAAENEAVRARAHYASARALARLNQNAEAIRSLELAAASPNAAWVPRVAADEDDLAALRADARVQKIVSSTASR